METAISVLGGLASFCLIVAYGAQSLQTIKSRDTAGINKVMFFVVLMACMLFTAMGSAMIAAGLYAGGVPILIANLTVGIFSGIVYMIKVRNSTNAKKANMSEAEYYKKYIEPKITGKR